MRQLLNVTLIPESFWKGLSLSLMVASMSLFMVGCDNEPDGPAEKLGEQIDDTADDLKDNTEELVNDAKRAAEDAAD